MPIHSKNGEEGKYSSDDWAHILLESMDDPVCLMDPSGLILDANPACIAWISRYYQSCIGSNIHKIISSHPALQLFYPQWKAMIEEVLHGGKSCSFENTGDEKTVRYTTYPVFSPDGKTKRLCIITREITDKKKKKNIELGSRHLWELILEKCHVGAWSMNLVSGTIYHTLEQDRLFGYDAPVNDWGYDQFRNHVIAEDREIVDKLFNEMLACCEAWDTEFRIRRTDGLIRWLSSAGAAMKDEYGKTVCISGISRDITEQKTSRIEHESFQAKMNYALENSHVGIWDIDLKSGIVNRTLEHDRIFGYDSLLPVWTVETFFHHIDPEEISSVREQYEKDIALKSDFKLECKIRKATGDIGWISLNGTFNLNESSNEDHIIGIVQEITHRKLAEIEQEKLQSQLQQSQKMELVGQLAGGIAHDFNNVLSAIMANAEVMANQTDENHPFSENLGSIRLAVNRSAEMVAHLLAFARKQVWRPQLIDLENELMHIRTMLTNLIRENIRFNWLLQQEHAMVNIDPSHLVQIITNLCVNARDAITGEGEIVIETLTLKGNARRKVEPGEPEEHEERVMISIADTGEGIAAEDLPRIFEPFFTTKETGKGTGLGLAVVYGIVKQNNGFIECLSEKGKGTTVRICFPQSGKKVKQFENPEQDLSPSTRSAGILLVEDELDILKIIKTLLESRKLIVMPAENAEKALEIFYEHREEIGMVISDIMLPGMNGVDLLQRLHTEKPELKYIFMSGYGFDALRHIEESGLIANFISKPFGIREFLDLVNSVNAD
jgi:two-component system, cell cycle sensor histidine kinase and response regulator CckA